jgi:hypothetical protein
MGILCQVIGTDSQGDPGVSDGARHRKGLGVGVGQRPEVVEGGAGDKEKGKEGDENCGVEKADLPPEISHAVGFPLRWQRIF